MGLVSFELLDQRMTQNGRHAGQTLPALAAHGLDLAVLAFGFSTLTARIDHAITSKRQLVGTDGAYTIEVDQPFRIEIGLKAIFRSLQVLTQRNQAFIHPARSRHRHVDLRFQLRLDIGLRQSVGGLCGSQVIRHGYRQINQLTLALDPD